MAHSRGNVGFFYTGATTERIETKVINDFDGKLESCPIWAFDGLSLIHI